MRIYFNIHKHYDQDLLAMYQSGISVTWIMKTALYHYVRGERVRILVPLCNDCEILGLKRYMKMNFNVTDPQSVEFLKTQIRPGNRSAFLKYLLRGSLVIPQYGQCFKHQEQRDKETIYLRSLLAEQDPSVIVYKITPKVKRDYVTEIIKPAGGKTGVKVSIIPTTAKNKAHEEEVPSGDPAATGHSSKRRHLSNRFGSVEDLAPASLHDAESNALDEERTEQDISTSDSENTAPADEFSNNETVTDSDFSELEADETEVDLDDTDDDLASTDALLAKFDALRMN